MYTQCLFSSHHSLTKNIFGFWTKQKKPQTGNLQLEGNTPMLVSGEVISLNNCHSLQKLNSWAKTLQEIIYICVIS